MATHKVTLYVTTDDASAIALGDDLAEETRDFARDAPVQYEGVKVKVIQTPLVSDRALASH